MLEHELQPPTSRQLRHYSHDLATLYGEVKDIAKAHSPRVVNDLNLSPVEKHIFQLLSEFAQKTRYANLDALGGHPADIDPLDQWGQILQCILKSEVKPRTIEIISRYASEIAASIAKISLIVDLDLSGKPISVYEALSSQRLFEIALGHAVRQVLRVLSAINAVLEDVAAAVGYHGMKSSDSAVVTAMDEFLQDFVNIDRRFVLRKKRWP